MKKIDKNQLVANSYSVSEAATVLGVSIPTLKRMAAEGRVENFRTPGGHLRILAGSVEAVRDNRQTYLRPVRDASPVLQNRRERLEELTLEAQEHRARRELTRLRQEEQEEAERQETETQAREQAAAQREAELEIERERLRLAHAKEEERREAERELAAFRRRWLDEANGLLSAPQYSWLSPSQRKEVVEGLIAEIDKCDLDEDEPHMPTILRCSFEALAEPFRHHLQLQERRNRVMQHALLKLPYGVTESERVRVAAAARNALRTIDLDTDEAEMRVTAQEAIQPLCAAIEKRLLDERLIDWAARELPWSRNERDEAHLRRGCAEILAGLPADASEEEAKEALESTISEAGQRIEEREKHKQREARKASLIREGVSEVFHYLLVLKQDGEISSEELWDFDLRADIEEVVREELESELSGKESNADVKDMVRDIVDEELD